MIVFVTNLGADPSKLALRTTASALVLAKSAAAIAEPAAAAGCIDVTAAAGSAAEAVRFPQPSANSSYSNIRPLKKARTVHEQNDLRCIAKMA